MKTFNGSKELKDELLSELKHHQDLDTFIQGKWLTNEKVDGNGYKGCFYGCTMQTSENPREKFSEKYNIPLWYCYVTERIFEGLPEKEAKEFPYKSIEIIPVGIDLNIARSKFNYSILEDQLRFCGENKEVKTAIRKCMDLFSVSFNEIDKSAAWSAAWSAESAAWSAESAAWSAARSAESAAWSAESAAWSAAESAAWSAESAAWSAESAARSAESDYYKFLRDTLFDSIKN